MKIKINSIIKFHTLLLLNEGPKHGYELMTKLKEKMESKISPSQIYPFVILLVKKGIVRIQKKGSRDKKIYIMTKDGKKLIENYIKRFADMVEIAIKPKLSVCNHCGCKVYSGGYKKKIGNKEIVFCCNYCAKACIKH